jgi:glutamate:GABA antiporter
VSLVVQGVVATVIFVTSLFLTLGGGQTTVQGAYDILVNLTVVVYFVPYLYLFVALIQLDRLRSSGSRLSTPGSREQASGMPEATAGSAESATGKSPTSEEREPSQDHTLARVWSWGLAVVGFVSTAIAVGLAFVPPPGTANTANYVLNLLLQTAVVMAGGVALFAISHRNSRG